MKRIKNVNIQNHNNYSRRSCSKESLWSAGQSGRRLASSDGEVVDGLLVVRVRQLLVADLGLGEADAAHVADRAADSQEPGLPEPLHGGHVDLPQPQAGAHAPHLVEGQAGELAAVAAGDEGGEEDHQQHVTTAPCSVVTLDGTVPAAVRRPQALGLTHYVVPQHLDVRVEVVGVTVVHGEGRRGSSHPGSFGFLLLGRVLPVFLLEVCVVRLELIGVNGAFPLYDDIGAPAILCKAEEQARPFSATQ